MAIPLFYILQVEALTRTHFHYYFIDLFRFRKSCAAKLRGKHCELRLRLRTPHYALFNLNGSRQFQQLQQTAVKHIVLKSLRDNRTKAF